MRKAEDDASDTLDKILASNFTIDAKAGPVRDWREARAKRVAFEQQHQIGGGA